MAQPPAKTQRFSCRRVLQVFDLRRSLTEVYQDMVDTFGGDTGGTTAVVPPVSRLISLTN